MRIKFSLALLAAILISGAAQAQDCSLKLITSIPMLDDKDGMVMVPATLGDKQTAMLVDTGGVFSMVGQHIVDELHPDVSNLATAGLRLVNGKSLKQIAEIEPFAMGNMRTHGFKFLVLPDGVVGPKDLDGTIAPEILANFDVEFDFAHKKLNFFSQDHCPGKVVYWTKDWAEIPFKSPDNLHIMLDMMLDGQPMQATLDTGSSNSYINASVAKRMFSVDAHSDRAHALPHKDADMHSDSGSSDAERAFGYKFKSLSAGGLTINNPDFVVLPDDTSSEYNHNGKMLLGMPEIRRFRIYIAYKEQVLYVTPADAK
jgi:predicted aspartyl protease